MVLGITSIPAVANMMAPDVCKIPSPPSGVVPVPLPNLGISSTNPPNPIFLQLFTPTICVVPPNPMTSGDEPGVAMGLTGTIKGPETVVKPSTAVLATFIPVTTMLNPNIKNTANTVGIKSSPSVPKVVILR